MPNIQSVLNGKLGLYDNGGEIIRSNQIRLLMVDMAHFGIQAWHFAYNIVNISVRADGGPFGGYF